MKTNILAGQFLLSKNQYFSERFDPTWGTVINGPADNLTDEQKKAAEKMARALFEAKLKRDEAIDDAVIKIRDKDKRDFSNLAGKCKREDKTVEQFLAEVAMSDDWKPVGTVGSGVEVVGIVGVEQGSIGEQFVSSEEFKDAMKHKGGGRFRGSVIAMLPGMFRNFAPKNTTPTTSSGLTSIQKQPEVIGLGVRPLRVKDLIAPGATNNTTVRYIQESSFSNLVTPVTETGTLPEQTFAFAEVDANVKDIGGWTKMSQNLMEDYVAVASFINERLPYMVERTEEDQILNGDGTGANLKGILNFSGILTQAKGGDTAIDAIYKAITVVRWGANIDTAAMTSQQGGFEPDGIIMHPTDWENIRLAKDLQGQYYGGGPFTGAYGSAGDFIRFDLLWGKPVVITPAIAKGTALVGAFRLASQYFQRAGLIIESTNSDGTDFQSRLMTLRGTLRLALAVYRPAGFCQVTGL